MAKIEEMTQEDIDKMESALERYKTENKKFREQRDEFKAAAEGNEANKALKERALRAEAKLAVSGLGVKDPDRIVKYLSLEGVDFDEEGKVTGLDSSINTVKTDFPELFDARRRVAGQIDAAAGAPVKVEKSATDMQLDRVFNKR